MGIGSLFVRNRDRGPDRQVRVLQTWDLGEIVPAGTRGMPTVGIGGGRYAGIMSIPGVWRGMNLLADLWGRLPLHVYTEVDHDDGVVVRRLRTPPLLKQPQPGQAKFTTMSSAALDVLGRGNAVGIISSRDEMGAPTGALWVPSEYVQVERVSEPLPGIPAGEALYWCGQRPFAAWDVIHVKGPCEPGALRGMGLIEAHLQGGLTLADTLEAYAAGVGNSAVPSVTIKVQNPDLTQAEADGLKAKFIELQKTRSPMVLNPTTEVTPLAWDPSEMQLIEARRFSLHQIALMLGLDPSWLGAAQTSRVYSNLEMEGINLTRYSAGGLIARFEGAFTQHLPPFQWAQANLDAELRPDTATRYGAHKTAIDAGFLTVDEVRALENRPPLPRPVPRPVEPTEEVGERDESDLWLYWVTGPGLAKWSAGDEPLTALYEQLVKHMPRAQAAASALSWFKDALGRDPTWEDGEVPDQPGAPAQPPALKQWIKKQRRAAGKG